MLQVYSMRAVLIALSLALFASMTPANAQDSDKASVQAVIASQIEAFLSDDAAGAYSHAAPTLKQVFPTPEAFVSMVREGYMPVYRPQSYAFGDYGLRGNTHIQSVNVIGPDGRFYVAVYTLMQAGDGFVITGCYIKPAQGV